MRYLTTSVLIALTAFLCSCAPPFPPKYKVRKSYEINHPVALVKSRCAPVLNAYLEKTYSKRGLMIRRGSRDEIVMCTLRKSAEETHHWNVWIQDDGNGGSRLEIHRFIRRATDHIPITRGKEEEEFVKRLREDLET